MKKTDKAFVIAVVSLTISAFTGFYTHIKPENFLVLNDNGDYVYHGIGIPVASLTAGVLAIIYLIYAWNKGKKDKG
ncbi:MAG: hypothetical protein LBO70_08455 [Clostridiales Family XIII bacterium]|nr:hypothetical protein [Clostridiales Family XIII bacterium]